MTGDNPKTVAQRFFMFCLLILGGVIALTLAVDFLAKIWGWLLLLGLVMIAIWVTVVVVRARRDRS